MAGPGLGILAGTAAQAFAPCLIAPRSLDSVPSSPMSTAASRRFLPLPALLRSFVLVLLLAVAQLGALAHALGHLQGDEGQGHAPETFCAWCAAYAQSGNAVPSAPAAPHFATAFVAPPLSLPAASMRQAVFFAYLSQAPPPLS